MSELPQLWLPILASAVLVFIASSLIHMVFKWHNSDYKKLDNEDAMRATVRAGGLNPGQYHFPHCGDMKEMNDPAQQQKYKDGPIGILTIIPNGMPNMGKMLGSWFLLNLLIAAMAACLAAQSFGLQGNAHLAGHLVGMSTFMAYGTGSVANAIWMGKTWSSVFKDLLDALIYGTVSALTFMWLWP
ncbi:hypothetical protein HPT27_07120 [Permianibacter sp. IMCC34836]|uniref:hypothetical protein n=1 Tax=Permianibacter fluminis TaxID=2738515 RepID=UPI0015537C44|nr:hypothetical protein [Permianibacter fluminis]NQD36793.1 hypothetical protein [Permianibacter fluminis]